MMRRKVLLGCGVILGLFPVSGGTYSLDTHLYIGSQVLVDALDGSVSLCAGAAAKAAVPGSQCHRQYPLPAATLAALQSHPNEFLAGTFGPDVFPDLVVPQLTVHPSVNGGWGADQWLQHLLGESSAPPGLAFAAGYLSHASADVFAHSWVNSYAGGIFDLLENSKSNEVELRHFVLERYLGDRTPRSWTRFGTVHAPHEWVADHLILSNAVATQYKKVAGATHLVAIEGLHELVGRIHRDARAIHGEAVKKASPLLAPLEQAKQMFKAAEEFMRLTEQSLEWSRKALAERDRLIGQFEGQLLGLAKVIDENPGLITRWGDQVEANKLAIDATESGLEGLRDVANAARRAFDLADEAFNRVEDATIVPCGLSFACRAARKARDLARGELNRHIDTLNGALQHINGLRNANAELSKKIDQAHQAIADAKVTQRSVELQLAQQRALRSAEQTGFEAATKAAGEARKAAADAQKHLDNLAEKLQPVTDFFARYDPILLFLQHWEADIRRASIGFSEASSQVAIHLVDRQAGNALAAYGSWIECWSPVLAAVPSEITHGVCTAKDIYNQLKNKLDQELENAVDALGSFGWLIAPGVKMKQEFDKKVRGPLMNQARQAVVHTGKEVTTFLANRQLADMIGYMSGVDKVTDEKLNGIFATDDSNQGLLAIPDIVQRVERDAGLAGGAEINEDRFAPLYNAIVLSKLALLDAATLNQVLHHLEKDVDPQAKPRSLFNGSGERFSILLDAVRSLDGNHQWQAVGLPYPRATGNGPHWPHDPGYGRPGRGSAHSGFLLWGDMRARGMAFKRLFKGPLSPALASHDAMRDYPFPECEAHPFASTTDAAGKRIQADRACDLVGTGTGANGIYEALSQRRVTRRELVGLSLVELRIARNEIFARHGYRFGPQPLRAHFAQQSWYRPGDKSPAQIQAAILAIEWRNIALIKSLERTARRT